MKYKSGEDECGVRRVRHLHNFVQSYVFKDGQKRPTCATGDAKGGNSGSKVQFWKPIRKARESRLATRMLEQLLYHVLFQIPTDD